MYSDRVSGVVIPFPQRARAQSVRPVHVSDAANWRVRAARSACAVAADMGVAALIAAMMAANVMLLAAAFGVRIP